jgi:hypothetical protein
MKASVTVNGQRIALGDRVQILVGPYASRFGIFKGRSRKQPKKVVVTPLLGCTRILIEANSIRKAEARP